MFTLTRAPSPSASAGTGSVMTEPAATSAVANLGGCDHHGVGADEGILADDGLVLVHAVELQVMEPAPTLTPEPMVVSPM